jgi:hypothetical protein
MAGFAEETGDFYKIDVLKTAAAVTASGSTAAFAGYARANKLVAELAVTAVSGTTPTLDLVLEDTLDGTNFYTVGAFVQVTATGRQVLRIPTTTPFTNRLRFRWTVAGTTPSFTIALSVYAES